MPAFRVRLHLGLQSRLPLLQRSLLLSAVNIVIYTIFYIVQTLIFNPICFVQAMPPVKRPCVSCPSTCAAKKSRPVGPPPEADVPPERTSTQNSGMTNLIWKLCPLPSQPRPSRPYKLQWLPAQHPQIVHHRSQAPHKCQKPWCPGLSSPRCPL